MASQLSSQAHAQQEREMEEMTDTLKNVCFGYQLSSAVAVVAAAAVAVAVALQSGGRAHIQDNKEGANNHRSHYLHMSPDTRDAT